MKLPVYKSDGSKTRRKVELDGSVFGITPNDHVLWLDVRRLQASRRQGTHKTKERGEVAGSMRKLYRQKGTGMARSGTNKSPLRRSGGRTFGPRPRKYSLKLSRKTRQLARRSALSYKAQDDAIRVVDQFAFETPSIRQLIDMIAALDLADQKVLFLTETSNDALYRSSTNLAKVHVEEARNASTEALLGAAVLVFEEGALGALTEALGGAPAAKAKKAPVEVEEPADEAPVEVDEPADEAPVEVEEPADEAPVEVNEPADEAPVDEAPVEVEEPADEAPVDEAPVEVAEPADETPVDEAPVEVDEPADEAPVEVAEPADEAPVEEAPAEVEEPADEAPAEVEEPADEAPGDEVDEPADEAATDEEPSKKDKD